MRRLRGILVAVVVLTSGLVLSPRVEAQGAPWTAIELKPLGAGWTTNVEDVNNAGISVGSSTSPPVIPFPGAIGTRIPVRWDANGNPTGLAVPPGCGGGEAIAIDEPGVILGEAYCGDASYAVEWIGASVLKLEPNVIPTDIDDNGISVGARVLPTGSTPDWQAYALWPPHPRLDLPYAPGTTRTIVHALTSWGYLVGTTSRDDHLPRATGWYGDQSFPLVSTDIANEGVDVNERGVALVQYLNPMGFSGVLVDPGGGQRPIDHSGVNDFMIDLNRYDVVLGRRQLTQNTGLGPTYAAAFYAFGGSIRLDALVSPQAVATFGFDQASALNDKAWVVGTSATKKLSWLLKPPA